jgi:hypothetical protein
MKHDYLEILLHPSTLDDVDAGKLGNLVLDRLTPGIAVIVRITDDARCKPWAVDNVTNYNRLTDDRPERGQFP